MLTVCTDNQEGKEECRRAYGVVNFANHILQEDYLLQATNHPVYFLRKLQKAKTAVNVGTGVTYQVLDDANARLYTRATDIDGNTVEDLGSFVKSLFYRLPDEPPRCMPAM